MIDFSSLSTEPFEVALLLIMLICLLATIRLKELYQQAVAFVIYMISLSGIYWILNAPILSAFQLTIYAGTTSVILFAALSIFREEESEEGT